MNEFKYIPEGKLESYVKLFWLGENYSPVSNKERVLPNGLSYLYLLSISSRRSDNHLLL